MTPTLTQETDFPPAASPAFVEEISEKRNTTLMTFFGKEVMLQNRSLLCLSLSNPLRLTCLKLMHFKWFDRFILTLIFLNSLILAFTDYSVVDATGEPVPRVGGVSSFGNDLVDKTELFFTTCFTFECGVKIIGLGLFAGQSTYLRSGWNKLDFVVVIAGLLGTLPWMPNISILRAFRILRPLRSLTMIPGMKLLINSMLGSIPALMNVMLLLFFVFLIMGILGLKLWTGLFHSRCRLTPFPIKLQSPSSYPANQTYLELAIANPSRYRCMNVSNDNSSWNMATSPWSVSQDCFWPIDSNIVRVCSLPHHAGEFHCPAGRVCGSNYDVSGNSRFTNPDVMTSDVRQLELNWGMTNFDNMVYAFLTIFQSITMEGWVDIMYMVQDAYSPWFAPIYFVSLILFGSFFLLNLTLAVIWDNFEKGQDSRDKEQKLLDAMNASQGEGEDEGSVEEPTRDLAHSNVMVRVCNAIVTHSFFTIFIFLLIVVNTVALAMDHHPMPRDLSNTIEIVNFVLAICFAVEMFLKIIGLGYRAYVRDRFNVFDAVIVTVSLVELVVSPPVFISGRVGGGGFSALRTFRLLRVFKLAHSWISFRVLLETIGRTLIDVANFGVILLLFIYIYALIGMQLFANKFRFHPVTDDVVSLGSEGYAVAVTPRYHFDYLWWAIVSIFQILTGENWNVIMYDGWRAVGPVAPVYFVSLVVFGTFIIMNLFLAILLGNFDGMEELYQKAELAQQKEDLLTSDEDSNTSLKEKFAGLFKNKSTLKQHDNRVVPLPSISENNEEKRSYPSAQDKSSRKAPGLSIMIPSSPRSPRREGSARLPPSTPRKDETRLTIKITTTDGHFYDVKVDSLLEETVRQLKQLVHQATRSPAERQTLILRGVILQDFQTLSEVGITDNCSVMVQDTYGVSMWLFPPEHPTRCSIAKLVHNSTFENAILGLIVISSLLLAIESPLWDPNGSAAGPFQLFDTVLTFLFALECAVKIFAYGFFWQRYSYLRNGWNILDFAIVVFSIMGLSGISGLKGLRSLRTFRALRPLRMISRLPELKLVVSSLFAAIPAIFNVVLVCILFLLIFAIVAVNYFKGKFFACKGDVFSSLVPELQMLVQDPIPYGMLNTTLKMQIPIMYNTTTSKAVCEALGALWEPVLSQHFDNVFAAMGSLFEMTTTEGWVDVMYAGIDATDIDMQPIRDHHVGWSVFFIFYMVVGSFFVMNLFVGIVIDNFNNMKNKVGGDSGLLMSASQMQWVKTQETLLKIRPQSKLKPPSGCLREWAFNIVQKEKFDPMILACISVNSLLMATTFLGQPYEFTVFLDVSNYIFTLIFNFEAVLKLLGYGKRYFRDRWNWFDLAIVIGADVGIIMDLTSDVSAGAVTSVLRTFRVGRIFGLVRRAKSLRTLYNSVLVTLPSLGNIGGLLFLLIFIYSVMGVQLFSTVKFGDYVNTHANFQNFWTAMLTLMRSSTGEAWNGIMVDLSVRTNCNMSVVFDPNMCGFSTDSENCVPVNGCGSNLAVAYFYSYTLLVTYVMLNLFIAVILEGFSQSSEEEENALTPAEFSQFEKVWADFDPDATCLISTMDLFIFLEKLPRPLGYGPEFGLKDLRSRQKEVATLMLPIYGQDHNLVHFHDVAHALSLRTHEDHAAGRGETLDMLPEGHRINKGWNKVFKSCKTPRSDFDVEMVYCVIQLQRSFRAYRFRKRIAERSSTQNPKQGQQFLRSQISADMSDDEEQLSRHIRPVTPVYNEVHISRNPNAISRAV